jgi:adenine-specific DNA-methyltransferase
MLASWGINFPYPKPLLLVQYLVQVFSRHNTSDLVVDFFAGSGTTGHAVIAQNASDGGDRRWIAVQYPEPIETTDEGPDSTIVQLTIKRLRKAGEEIRARYPMFAGDTGFRVFKLDSTNIQAWEPDREDLPGTLEDAIEHLKDGRTEQDILYELLLKLGLDLCVPIERRDIAGKEVHAVGGGALLVCLAPRISRVDVEELANGIAAWFVELAPAGEATCVFRDSAFEDDVAKTNAAAILAQRGLPHVRSL